MEGETREKVFNYIRQQLLAGIPPTMRDIQKAFKFKSVGTVRDHVDKLLEEGRLVKEPGLSRGLRLPAATQIPRRTLAVPLIGSVPAGIPDIAREEPIDYLMLTTRLPVHELFALRVRGESMKNAGILPNDIVFVRRQDVAAHGQIVVARLGDEEATVKTLHVRADNRRELHPANPDYPVLVPTPRRPLTIIGVVIEVRRPIPLRVEIYD